MMKEWMHGCVWIDGWRSDGWITNRQIVGLVTGCMRDEWKCMAEWMDRWMEYMLLAKEC